MPSLLEDVLYTGHAGTIPELLGAELAPEFRIIRPLGTGAAARVYLASETGLERLVAVKALRPDLSGDERVVRRFLREARSSARIVHPHVITVHRVGELSDGTPYIIMEYIPGRTLAAELEASGPPGGARAAAILAQLASALATAHEQGVIHRDVRPGNVLVEPRGGRVVLTDFGIAGIEETGSEAVTRLTREGEALGDPRYASPEQLLAEPVTAAADLYSLGVLGFELLTGRPPFPDGTVEERIAAKLGSDTPQLRVEDPDVPPGAIVLLERCLARRPEARPVARDVLRSLEPSPASGGAAVGGRASEPPYHRFPLLGGFLAELRRRRVYRTAAAYLAGAFVLLEAAGLVLPTLSAPEWVYRAMVVAVLGAFPGVLVLSWVFDLTRSGIRRTEGGPQAGGSRVALEVGGVVVSAAIAGLLAWWLL